MAVGGFNIRREERHGIAVQGRYRTGAGIPRDISVLDISEGGCRFFDKFGRLAPGKIITLKIGPIGPLSAVVRWNEKQVVGVEFEDPIYGPVLDHIRARLDEGRRKEG